MRWANPPPDAWIDDDDDDADLRDEIRDLRIRQHALEIAVARAKAAGGNVIAIEAVEQALDDSHQIGHTA